MNIRKGIVIKRDGKTEDFDFSKIERAIEKAFSACNEIINTDVINSLEEWCNESLTTNSSIKVEDIQNRIEVLLMEYKCYEVAKEFIIYREKHRELRYVDDGVEYIEDYINNEESAATSSKLDANANVQNKNVATLDAEVPKDLFLKMNRRRVEKKLKQMYGNDAPDYIKALDSHIIYKHDESSSPATKPYCMAANMYPFFTKGSNALDKLKAGTPNNMRGFCGQFGNFVFLLSSQFLGAVAFGEFFNLFNYYCVKEWGENYYLKDGIVVTDTGLKKRTISDEIEQAFQDITYSVNQPAGNRSFQSPFTNISYYDSNYWNALFADFSYPDGTKPEWKAIDYLQKKYMRWFNKERTKTLLTFPVETMALLSDGVDILDKDYKDFTTEMYAEGHSFFTYISDSADALSSCCRLRNKLDKNTFSFTNGLTGVATGSKSVITLNMNRIIQNFSDTVHIPSISGYNFSKWNLRFYKFLSGILSDIYKFHSAYNELLWDLYDRGKLPAYSEGFIHLNQQYLTIGINGLNEAAEFLDIKVRDNHIYNTFCSYILKCINENNREAEKHPYNPKHVLKFNTEMVPAESLGVKNYNWDKKDGYIVHKNRNCYNSYFYEPDDEDVSILEKFRLHGKKYTENLDGGVALHCNLTENLSKKQYVKLVDYAIKQGTNYFTFNVPQSQCDSCGYIIKHPVDKCPVCGSDHITLWSRIIGYLRPIKCFGKPREIEFSKRQFTEVNTNKDVNDDNCSQITIHTAGTV